jgi:DNA-binding NtrC family response regulator
MQDQVARATNPVPTPAQKPHSRILVVDDDDDACEALRQLLALEGFDATPETSACRALERVAAQDFDLVMSDVSMPEMSGLDFCRHIVETRPGMPVILVTGRGTMDTAVGALRCGARDFLTKPFDVDSLVVSVVRALRHCAPIDPGVALVPKVTGLLSEQSLANLLGQSVPIRRLRELISSLSDSAASVLVQGETGTGKELVARALHANSRFANGPFVALNCAAMPAGLLEAELFGHARGAFTGAKQARTGLLVQANGGTVLLDEISELPLAMQPKLLRALQERTVRPLGENREIPFDCRIIAAANQDLDAEVSAKRFREDLYYRLDVVRLTVPPLRERGDDIPLLARHFLARFAGASQRSMTLAASAVDRILTYAWPGNVRELENCIERSVALARHDELGVDDLPEKLRLATSLQRDKDTPPLGLLSLPNLERRHTLRALEQLGGNMTRAAKLLGIDRATLYRRLKRYDGTKPS